MREGGAERKCTKSEEYLTTGVQKGDAKNLPPVIANLWTARPIQVEHNFWQKYPSRLLWDPQYHLRTVFAAKTFFLCFLAP